MPKPRDTLAGRFHVYTHCVWIADAYFRDDVDRMFFLRTLARVTARTHWRCLAYCLMTSHYHLIVDVEDGVLPKAMYSLNFVYARRFNSRYGLRGHVQFDRFGARRIESDDDLLTSFAYVAKNPVKAGLCNRPQDWRWSSYAGTIGIDALTTLVDPSPLFACLGLHRAEAAKALQRHVEGS